LEHKLTSPFFSVCVPTYNRYELLKQTLLSVLNQTFTDFEIIIGNDYVEKPLLLDDLGIRDSRIKVINHPFNLGEVENMNSLYKAGKGKYVTWLFDDDLFSPYFLEIVYTSLVQNNFSKCVFTSFGCIYGISLPKIKKKHAYKTRNYTGIQFLQKYLTSKSRIHESGGVFSKEFLNNIGGIKKLVDYPIGALSEFLIPVEASLLDQVVYINAKLVFVRLHQESWSYSISSTAADIYKQAGNNFIHECAKILANPLLEGFFRQNFTSLLNFLLNIIAIKMTIRDGYLNRQELEVYIDSLKKEVDFLKGSYLYQLALNDINSVKKKKRILQIIIGIVKSKAPEGIVKLAHFMLSLISKFL